MNTIPAANILWPAPTATSLPSASRPVAGAPAGQKDPANAAETAAAAADLAYCMPLPQATPKWRLGPDPVPLQREPSGSAWPPGGKGLPPQLPKMPVPLPAGLGSAPDAQAVAGADGACMPLAAQAPKWRLPPTAVPLTLAPGADPIAGGDKNPPPQLPQLPVMPMPIAGPDAEPSKIAQALAALKGKESPTASPPGTPIPGLGVKGDEVPARLPQEIIGGSPMPTLPVLPPGRPVDRIPREPALGRKPGASPGLTVVRSVPAPQDLRAATEGMVSAASGTVPERAAASEITRNVDPVAQFSSEPDAAIASASASGSAAARSAQPSPPAAAPMQGYLPHLVGSDEWIEAVAERVGQMTDGAHGRANLRLNPAQLGPMQIEVHVEGDRAVVSLAVRHDATGDALERAMPNLRAQLADSGFASVDVSISRHPQREHAGAGDPYARASLHADEDVLPATTRPIAAAVSRLLDAYA